MASAGKVFAGVWVVVWAYLAFTPSESDHKTTFLIVAAVGPLVALLAIFAQADAGMKTCPMCAERIKSAARVCRHCGHSFDT